MGLCFVAVLLGIISKTPEVTLKLKSPCICYGFANNIYVTIVICTKKNFHCRYISNLFFSNSTIEIKFLGVIRLEQLPY